MRRLQLACLLLASCVAADDTVTVATSADGATEPENPYSASGDTTQECYAWAADSQCAVNPGFMHSSCKYSCWEWYQFRAKKYPNYNKIDKLMDCHSWAQSGECGKNAAFMKANRPESCKDRGYDPPPPPPEADPAKKKKKKKKKKKRAEE